MRRSAQGCRAAGLEEICGTLQRREPAGAQEVGALRALLQSAAVTSSSLPSLEEGFEVPVDPGSRTARRSPAPGSSRDSAGGEGGASPTA